MNPQVLRWSTQNELAISLEEVFRSSSASTMAYWQRFERLAAMETGEDEPSRSILAKMARSLSPLLVCVFYLSEPPKKGDRGHDFRRVPGSKEPDYNPELDALIRDQEGRALSSLSSKTLNPKKLAFIGSETTATPVDVLAERITKHIKFSLAEFRAKGSSSEAFTYLRSKIEDSEHLLCLCFWGSGEVIILKISDAFRGFAIADSVAPFAVVNDQDAKAAWSFTAVHELVHLWLGATGLGSGGSAALKLRN